MDQGERLGRAVEHSYWQRIGAMPAPAERRTPQDLPSRAAFVVIGGGFAGLSTALRIKELHPAAEIVLLEAKSVGYGASGRNGGLISPLAAPVWLASALSSPAHARAMMLLNRKAAAAAAWARAQAPDAEVRATDLALEAQGSLTRAGIGQVAAVLERAEISHRFEAASGRDPALVLAASTINPYRLVLGLAGAARRAGILVIEGAPVVKLTDVGGAAEVRLASGHTIQAGTAVLCTNAYTPSIELRDSPKAKVVHNYMIATEPLSHEALLRLERDGTAHGRFVVELNTAYVFYRIHEGRLVFGGIEKMKQQGVGDLDVPVAVLKGLQKLIGETLAGIPQPRIVEAWGGRFHMTATDLPIIERTAASPAIVRNVGYGGTGVALTLTLAPIAAALALGRQPADPDLAQVHAMMRDTRLPIAGGARFVAGVLKRLVTGRAHRAI